LRMVVRPKSGHAGWDRRLFPVRVAVQMLIDVCDAVFPELDRCVADG
jgi:hypothetical protein